MARVAIVTSYYPYGHPEQFFEAEIPLWAASGHDVTLLPMRSQGPTRWVPEGIVVDTSLAVLDSPKRTGTLSNLVRACFDLSTLREIVQLARERRLNLRSLAETISTEAQVKYLEKRLTKLAERDGGYDVVYTYWHGTAAYAAGVAASRGAHIGCVVSRAHRVDVDEEARPTGHYPRKRHYQAMIDLHVPISDAGAEYLIRTYGVDPRRLLVSRLGCTIPARRAVPSPDGEFCILSASFVTPLKRVDEIHRGIRDFARMHPTLNVRWTHLGDGPDLQSVRDAADSLAIANLKVALPGQVPHEEVLEHFSTHPVDVFVNFSTIEGVPVSIMEAMAHGVPAIAPAVGGIPEIVDSAVGHLLSTEATSSDLSHALTRMAGTAKSPELRDAAHRRIVERYDARANFQQFIDRIT